MPAYVVVEIAIHDPVTYERYRELAPPSISAYGGRYLVRGAPIEVLEGTWCPPRFVMLEFPDPAASGPAPGGARRSTAAPTPGCCWSKRCPQFRKAGVSEGHFWSDLGLG